MNRLYPEKLLNIITIDALEGKLVESFRKYGASGYTILRAQGEGSSGVRSDMTGFDANIMIKVIIPPERLTAMLDSLERKINKGHHLTVFIVDVEVLSPEKFNARMR
ncbi:MAG: transcriptional regulator [Gammaproteobacteria bacterium]|nr:MAG: transcriptional regulator [Gammaproteobacteria bacterium]